MSAHLFILPSRESKRIKKECGRKRKEKNKQHGNAPNQVNAEEESRSNRTSSVSQTSSSIVQVASAFCCVTVFICWASAQHFSSPLTATFCPHVKRGIGLASWTAALHVFSRQTSSRWNANCCWLHTRRTPKELRFHLLSHADRWWLVCLPVLRFWGEG